MRKIGEIYWYDDQKSGEMIIGERGGKEIKINQWEGEKLHWKLSVKIGRTPTSEEFYRFLFKNKALEDEYVDFEIVKPEIKLLS
jgi:hypothetical protein